MTYQCCIRLAEIFDHDPKNRVADKEKSHQHSVRLSRPGAYEPQNRKQNNALKKGFVELGRMPGRQNRAQRRYDLRLSMDSGDNRFRRGERWINLTARRNCAVRFCRMFEQFFWKLDRPGNAGNATVKLAVNEISAAAKEQTDRRSHAKIVSQIHPRNLMSVRVVKGEEQQPNHPAVARHSAFPYSQDRQWRAQHFGIVKENVTEPPADDDAEKSGAGNEVSDPLHGQIGISAFGQPEKKDKAGDKCQDIGQA